MAVTANTQAPRLTKYLQISVQLLAAEQCKDVLEE